MRRDGSLHGRDSSQGTGGTFPGCYCAAHRASAQQAIACHEMAHIRRGDWGYTIAEEIIRAVFWFHPCIWWLLGQIQLTREQAVDCLRTAANAWARGDAANPPPAAVWEQLWDILRQEGVLV